MLIEDCRLGTEAELRVAKLTLKGEERGIVVVSLFGGGREWGAELWISGGEEPITFVSAGRIGRQMSQFG